MTPHSFNRRSLQNGFSLIEAMVVLAVVAILAGFAIPSMQTLVLSNRLSVAANDMMSTMAYARNESVARNARVVVCSGNDPVAPTDCADDDNWSSWIVFVDDGDGTALNDTVDAGEVILRTGSPPQGLTASPSAALAAQANAIRFSGDGYVYDAAGEPITFALTYCTSSLEANNARVLSLASGSRPSVAKGTVSCG